MIIVATEEAAISSHLASITKTKDITLFSGFMAALRDARKFTKRDQDTGHKLHGDDCGNFGSWLGAVGYLILLDQIGGCFKPKSAKNIDGNQIIKALRYFTELSLLEAKAIYALRCAFAHDFSLLNIHDKPGLTHIFTANQGTTSPVVTLPIVPWDGNILNMYPENVTRINLEALGDLVENIYVKLIELSNSSDLKIELKGGPQELHIRYSFYSPNTRI